MLDRWAGECRRQTAELGFFLRSIRWKGKQGRQRKMSEGKIMNDTRKRNF